MALKVLQGVKCIPGNQYFIQKTTYLQRNQYLVSDFVLLRFVCLFHFFRTENILD